MNWFDPLFLTSGLSGLTLIIAALVSQKYPPMDINDFYGYRTGTSMKSQEAWNYAQTFSNNLMVWVGGYNCLVALTGLFISLHLGWALGISLSFLIASCIYMYWKTEKELKKRFGE